MKKKRTPAQKKALKKKAVKKKHAKKKVASKKSGSNIFSTLDSLVRQVAINFAQERLDDMPGYAEHADMQASFLLPRVSANYCYFHLVPEKGVICVSTKVKDLRKSIVRKEVCKAAGFNPFQQKGLLPPNLAQRDTGYSYTEVQELMKVLCNKLGKAELSGTMENLNQYVQFMQNTGDYKTVVNASIHPYVVAMAVVGAAKLPPKQRRLRNIMLHALRKSGSVKKFEASKAWTEWKSRFEKTGSENDLIFLVKHNLQDLFVNLSVAAFCKSAEELGEEFVSTQKSNSYRKKQDTSDYFTEGYQAYKAYCRVVKGFQEALVKSVQ